MPTRNVNLPAGQARFIQQKVRSGRYQNASEVVRAGLRLLEQREAEDLARVRALKRVAKEAFGALDRGGASAFTTDTLDEFFSRIDRQTGRR